MTELKHEKEVPSKTLVYKEEMYKESGAEGGYASKYSMIEGDVKLQPLKNVGGKEKAGGGLNIGVSQAIWSHNSSYLATKHCKCEIKLRIIPKCCVDMGYAHNATFSSFTLDSSS